ncbi:E3 ubiquitin-protein ligase [Giardia duodenalis]|uniref:E3 ubiquitin-protein ligase n=1 Tax=Giardia intestinalis (strain ATCC 50803 / WB clone C6) TaxID=184922 RepID=A8BU27_GIAIC|nr:E3 ubiquitin-protein ligase [Giardia intestinalis]KAE8304578.1 E3 ubiquitin-protein ligase [Giardia intestinalis]|eukprot:XP_001704801.1 Ubiquitin [Giardia lamblia ATCC 50803]
MDGDNQTPLTKSPERSLWSMDKLIETLSILTAPEKASSMSLMGKGGIFDLATSFNVWSTNLFLSSNLRPDQGAAIVFNFLISRIFKEDYVTGLIRARAASSSPALLGESVDKELKIREVLFGCSENPEHHTPLSQSPCLDLNDCSKFYYPESYIHSELFMKLHGEELPLSICGKVLNSHLGFKCQYCTTDKSSVMCLECFDESKHVGHEYRCFFSTGLCDCGSVVSTGKTGVCARHLGDNYSKNALSVYTGIVGSSCDLAMLCNVAVFLSVALLQSIIFPIEAFLTNLTAIDAGALGDSPAISIASAKRSDLECSVQSLVNNVFHHLFINVKIDGFWRILSKVLTIPVTNSTTVGDILAYDPVHQRYYRDVMAFAQKLVSSRRSLIAGISKLRSNALSLSMLMEDLAEGLVLSDIIFSLSLFKVILDKEKLCLSRTTTASGLEHDQRWLTVDSPALNDLLKFIVDGLIFEPIYRVFLCNIYHWYYPYLFIGALNNDISEGPWDLAADKLAHAFTHDPPMFCKYKPRFLQIQRAFAYGPISFSVVNEAIKQLSLIYNDKYAETFDAAYLHSYLLENFKLPHRVIPQDNVWTRAPVQIYTEFNPVDEACHLIAGYILSTVYLSLSISFVPNYLHRERALLFREYIFKTLHDNYIDCGQLGAGMASTAAENGSLTDTIFNSIFRGLDESLPYMCCIPNGFLPISNLDNGEYGDDTRFAIEAHRSFFDVYLSSCIGVHHPIAYSGKMSNFTQSSFFHPLPAMALLAVISSLTTVDALQVMYGNHLEMDTEFGTTRYRNVLTYSDFTTYFTYGAWFAFTHGPFYNDNPMFPNDTISRKHCDAFKLAELRGKFGRNDSEIQTGNAYILSFLHLLCMFILTINNSEALSFEPLFQGAKEIEREQASVEALKTGSSTVEKFDYHELDLEVHIYHPIFLPLHYILGYTLGAVSTRNAFGISSVAVSDVIAQTIDRIISLNNYVEEPVSILKVQLFNLCCHYNNVLKGSSIFTEYLRASCLTPEEQKLAVEIGICDLAHDEEYVSPCLVRPRHTVWNQYQNIFWNEACLPGLNVRTRIALELVLLPFKTLIAIALNFSEMFVRSGMAQKYIFYVLMNSSRACSADLLSMGYACQSVLRFLYDQQESCPGGLEAFFFILFNLAERRIALEKDLAKVTNARALILKTAISFLCFDYSPRTVENQLALLYLPRLVDASPDDTVVSIVDSCMRLTFWREPTVMGTLAQVCDIIYPATDALNTDVYSITECAAYYRLNKKGWAYTSIYSPTVTGIDYVDAWERYCRETNQPQEDCSTDRRVPVPVPQCVAGLTALSNDVEKLDGDYADLISIHGNGLSPALTAAVMRIPCVGLYICQVFADAVLSHFTRTDVESSLRPTVVLCLCNTFFLLHHYTIRDVPEHAGAGAPSLVDPAVKKAVTETYDALYTYIKSVLDSGISHCFFNDSIMEFLRTVVYREKFQPEVSLVDSELSTTKPITKKPKRKLAFLKEKLGPSKSGILMSIDDLTSLETLTSISHEPAKNSNLDTQQFFPASVGKVLYEVVQSIIVNNDTQCYNCRLFDVPELPICQPVAFVPNSLNKLYANILKQSHKGDKEFSNILEHPWINPARQLFDKDLVLIAYPPLPADQHLEEIAHHTNHIKYKDAFRGVIFSKSTTLSIWNAIPLVHSLSDKLYDVPTVKYFIRVAGCKHFSHSSCLSFNKITSLPKTCSICRRFYNTCLPVVTAYKSQSSSPEGIAKLKEQLLEEFRLQSLAMAMCMSVLIYHGNATIALSTQQLYAEFVSASSFSLTESPTAQLLFPRRSARHQETSLAHSQNLIYSAWYIMFSDLILYNTFLTLHGFSIGLQSKLFTDSRLMTMLGSNLSSLGSVVLIAQITLSFLINRYGPNLCTIAFGPARMRCTHILQQELFMELHRSFVKVLETLIGILKDTERTPKTKNMYGFVDNISAESGSTEKVVYWAQGNSMTLTDREISQAILDQNDGRRELSLKAQCIIPSIYNFSQVNCYLGIFLQISNRIVGVIGFPLFMHYLGQLLACFDLLHPGEDVFLPFTNLYENPAVVFVALFLSYEVGLFSITEPSVLISEQQYHNLHSQYNSCPSDALSYQSYCQREALMARSLIVDHAHISMRHSSDYDLALFAESVAEALNELTTKLGYDEEQTPWNAGLIIELFTEINDTLGLAYQGWKTTNYSQDEILSNICATMPRFEHRKFVILAKNALTAARSIVTPGELYLFVHAFKASHVLSAVGTFFGNTASEHNKVISSISSLEGYSLHARRFCMTHLRSFVDSRHSFTVAAPPSSYGLYSMIAGRDSLRITPLDYSRRYLYKVFPFSYTAVKALKKYITDKHACPYCKYTPERSKNDEINLIVCMMCGQCFCNFCGHTHTNINIQETPDYLDIDRFLALHDSLDVWTPVIDISAKALHKYSIFISILHHSAACILPAVFYLPAQNKILCLNGTGVIWTQPAPMLSKYGDPDVNMRDGIPVRLAEEQVGRLFATVLINGLLDLPVEHNGFFSIPYYLG